MVLDETGALEHPKVLAHAGATHRQSVGEFTDGERSLAQRLHDASPHRFAQCVEDDFG
ncbi:hypothetical protein KACC15558_13540 [Brevibacterium ammoniilyticum]|uniref:Uncharacterized protein n=1 Tax=Brevibacterium ammoniilyticum TaxID=1046555 RepID=A0ABP9U2B2_9MICO